MLPVTEVVWKEAYVSGAHQTSPEVTVSPESPLKHAGISFSVHVLLEFKG